MACSPGRPVHFSSTPSAIAMRRPSPTALAIFLIVACVLFVGLQRAAQDKGKLSGPESGVFLVLRPLQSGFNGIGAWASDVGRALFRRPSLVSENQRLLKEVDDLRGQTQRMARYPAENQELRKLLGMPKPNGGVSISSEVIGFNATDISRALTLNVGARSQVRPKDIVFNAQGVVGQVSEVSPFSSRVLPLTDRMSGVGAMISRTMARGVLKGADDRICKLSYLDYRADVREGDLVITSGASQIFPRGLVLGHVIKVERDKRYSQLTAYVDPAVAFDRLSAVYVRVRAG